MRTRKVNYLEGESKDGSFSPHIYDRKLVKKIETICMIKGINRTHYVIDIINAQVEKDLKDLQSKHNNSIEIEYVDADGGGITYISTKEQLKELINFASYKDGYEVLIIK